MVRPCSLSTRLLPAQNLVKRTRKLEAKLWGMIAQHERKRKRVSSPWARWWRRAAIGAQCRARHWNWGFGGVSGAGLPGGERQRDGRGAGVGEGSGGDGGGRA